MSHLLDTCTLLWMTDNPSQLSKPVQDIFSDRNASFFVSAVTAMELGLKVAKKKLQLPQPVSRWFPVVCRRNRILEIPLTSAMASASTELPALHADPFDRILVATAQMNNLT